MNNGIIKQHAYRETKREIYFHLTREVFYQRD